MTQKMNDRKASLQESPAGSYNKYIQKEVDL